MSNFITITENGKEIIINKSFIAMITKDLNNDSAVIHIFGTNPIKTDNKYDDIVKSIYGQHLCIKG